MPVCSAVVHVLNLNVLFECAVLPALALSSSASQSWRLGRFALGLRRWLVVLLSMVPVLCYVATVMDHGMVPSHVLINVLCVSSRRWSCVLFVDSRHSCVV